MLRPFSGLTILPADGALYRRFRVLEPALVSCVDGQDADCAAYLMHLSVQSYGIAAGLVSIVVRTNPRRTSPVNRYARIDLVIVEERFRNLGLARLLVFASLVHLMETFGRKLYSISCLAAHGAIESILKQVQFSCTPRANRDFVHQELVLDGGDVDGWIDRFSMMVSEAAYAAQYRIRQQQVAGQTPVVATSV